MLFWIIAALLTAGASLAVLLPLSRGGGRMAGAAEHEIEVYRDQLAELDRDMARGLIAPQEAEEARAEIGRRVLKLKGEQGAGKAASAPFLSRGLGAICVLAVPLVSWGLYTQTGSPDLPGQPIASRAQPAPEDEAIDTLVARAEAHLAANPDDARGWEVLAPVYMRLGRFDESVAAYRKLIALEGANADRQAALGEALVNGAEGDVTEAAQAAFKAAVALDPKNAKARFYLASAQAQGGDLAGARAALTALLDEGGPQAPWHAAVSGAIAEIDARQTGAAPTTASGAPGPSADDMAAAQEMSAADRTAMIEGMVAGLDQKLRDNPNDAEGWMRLVRSYMVLGRADEARGALERGLKALDAGSEDGRRLAALATELGIGAVQ